MPDQITVKLAQEQDTVSLGQDIAAVLECGDVIAVTGDLGAGKSTLIRAAIRALANDPTLDVPSPTFALRIDYELDRLPVVHSDLYRLSDPADVDEIGLEEVTRFGALFVEWPERAPDLPMQNGLKIELNTENDGRAAIIQPFGSWTDRLARTGAIRAFIGKTDFANASRTPIAGDASGRAYERLTLPGGSGRTAILMNASVQLSSGATKEKEAYDKIVHRSDDPTVFVAIANALRARAIQAPEPLEADYDRGLILLEDFGTDGLVDHAGCAMSERYLAAMQTLSDLHEADLSRDIPMPTGGSYEIPVYDRDALLAEVSVYFDWVVDNGMPGEAPDPARQEFLAAWAETLADIDLNETTWVLRDFHSPNIFWRPGKQGNEANAVQNIAIIDFQDMVLGHPAYDCVSLGQDARVTLSQELESDLLNAYFSARSFSDRQRSDFRRDYAIFGAQRASKILGAFQRFANKDGNPAYLRHVDRVRAYLARNLEHPSLARIRSLYEHHIQCRGN